MKHNVWPRHLFPGLYLSVGVMFLIHMATQLVPESLRQHQFLTKLLDNFNLDAEAAIPSWFSTILLFCCALVLFFIGRDARAVGARWWRHWYFLALVFAYLSLDEAAEFHEIIAPLFSRFFDLTTGPLSYSWVIPYGILVIVGLLVFVPFFRALDRRIRFWFFLSLGIYILGSVGFEVVEAALRLDIDRESMQFLVGFEEGLELVGTVTFLRALRDQRRLPVPD